MPGDEQSKTMLYAALKLRLSLVGSMLATICTAESTTLEWTALLMQLICSGAVDRQTDSRWAGEGGREGGRGEGGGKGGREGGRGGGREGRRREGMRKGGRREGEERGREYMCMCNSSSFQ